MFPAMRLALAAAAWVLASSFPQGKLYRLEEPGSDVVALRAEGRLRAPAWAVLAVLLEGWRSDRISPYLAEHRVLHAEGCEGGAREISGCRAVWAYERYEPPVVGARDYAFRMERAFDRLDEGGGFELRWEIDESRGAPPEGVTHMRRNTGAWTVRADGDATRFSYRISVDPGGGLPAWVVNMANRSQVPSVIAAVEEEALKLAEARAARGGDGAARPGGAAGGGTGPAGSGSPGASVPPTPPAGGDAAAGGAPAVTGERRAAPP
jgi:hypothetical protein